MSGNPILASQAEQKKWESVANAAYEKLLADLAAGVPTVLDSYAATNRAEYFAVACEVFFEIPNQLKYHHSELYDCLTQLFNSDPANWNTT